MILNFRNLLIATLILLVISGCQSKADYLSFSGYTMGTTYSIKLKLSAEQSAPLKKVVEQILDDINQKMSTYIDNSELSLFNQQQTTNCVALSKDTLKVMREAHRIYQITHGAFDPSVGPLIEIWGFDKKDTGEKVPSKQQIADAKQMTGFLEFSSSCAQKNHKALYINLSAIAKGYAVDVLAEAIETKFNSLHYMVEVGGEVRTKGNSPRGTPWNIAIESPTTDSRTVQKIINPGIMAVATSGDYRNYFEKNGKRFSHTINPVNGYPITHNLASVTVVHPSAMTADGLATAIMVMGAEQGLELANQEKFAVFMIVKTPEGFKEVSNTLFENYVKKDPQ